MINKNTAYEDDLLATTWLGEVVDIEDPQKVGRIKVKVYGKFDDLKKEDIPWAYPGNNHTGASPSGGGFFSVPKLGSIVSVKFDMGNIYHPEYFFQQKISDEVKSEISGSYPNAHVIIYDTVTEGSLKIFFTESKGLMLDYKETQINIKNDKSIDIHTASKKSTINIHDDGKMEIYNASDVKIKCDTKVTLEAKDVIIKQSNLIELGGEGLADPVILGQKFLTLFNSHTHIGNLGAPTSPPTSPMTPAAHLSGKGGTPKVTVK